MNVLSIVISTLVNISLILHTINLYRVINNADLKNKTTKIELGFLFEQYKNKEKAKNTEEEVKSFDYSQKDKECV